MYSYVCVLSTNNYLEGVLVINENLKHLKSKYKLLCLINENIDDTTRETLSRFNIEYKEMKSINPQNPNNRWAYTFDKLNIFDLEEYEKIVYLDLDFLILENIDNLFEIDRFAMVSDANKDHNFFCSALMVIKPNHKDYIGLVDLYNDTIKNTDCVIGDQQIINDYFDDIYEIPLEYNFLKAVQTELIDSFDFIKNEFIKKHKCKDYYVSINPKIIHYYGDFKPFFVNNQFDDKYCNLYFYYLESVRKQKNEIKKEK